MRDVKSGPRVARRQKGGLMAQSYVDIRGKGYDADVIPRLWSIILAGGEGLRLAPFIEQWLGEKRPKQYCAFTGTRSMLQHTVDRADWLSIPQQRVTVVGTRHERQAQDQLAERGGSLVVQPLNRDTAAGVFLPLTYVRAADPNATVVIYPSDHFVHPEEKLLEAIRHAVLAIDLLKDRVILLGIEPEDMDPDYGYLLLDRSVGSYGDHSLWHVGRFVEKPERHQAKSFEKGRVLWNTMIVVAKVDTLWKLGMYVLPSMIRLLETFMPAIGSERESEVLNGIYETMPMRNFSKDLLEQIPNKVSALDVRGLLWSDWGRPERIRESLLRIGRTPVFPTDLIGVA